MKITEYEWGVIYRALNHYVIDMSARGIKELFPELRHATGLRNAISKVVSGLEDTGPEYAPKSEDVTAERLKELRKKHLEDFERLNKGMHLQTDDALTVYEDRAASLAIIHQLEEELAKMKGKNNEPR